MEKRVLAVSDQRPVAVLGADSPIGLTLIRELGEHGTPVLALGKTGHALGRYSRHATGFALIETPLARWLPGFVATHRPAAIMAVSEHHLIELAALKDKLGECRVLCPDPEPLAVVLDKQRTLTIAAELGLQVPASWLPLPAEDFTAKAGALRYPVAVKWPDPNAVSGRLGAEGIALEKVEYAADAGALLALLHRYDGLAAWPLVQEWCAGYGLGQMLNLHDGAATLRFQHRRLREWPPSGGVSSFCEAISPDRHRRQMALSERLLQTIGWEGPAMVEYRHDPATGAYWLMEINGRFWGSIPLAYHCGAHFAWEAYRCQVLGEGGPASGQARLLKARYAIPDAKHLVAVLRDPARTARQRLALAARFLGDFLDPAVRWYVWSVRDPGPLLGDLRAIVRKLWRRDKPRTGG